MRGEGVSSQKIISKSPGFFERHPYLSRSIWRRIHSPLNAALYRNLHVNEFPKSGGTWTCKMIRDCLDWRFDDNTYPWFGNSIIKHHRIDLSASPAVVVIRDPRDVAVSYYHHNKAIFQDDPFNRGNVNLSSKYIFGEEVDEAAKLDKFVETIVLNPIYPRFTWGDFYRMHSDAGNVVVRYEDLRGDTEGTLGAMFDKLGLRVGSDVIKDVVSKHDIKKILAKRGNDSGPNFIRKGSVGGWRDVLSDQAVSLIEKDAGDLLQTFQYS